jgi:molecular chaperone DnaK
LLESPGCKYVAAGCSGRATRSTDRPAVPVVPRRLEQRSAPCYSEFTRFTSVGTDTQSVQTRFIAMDTSRAVGIDLGTTYSCIASLNEQGEPVSIPNEEGEISTPSVVLYDGDEVIVGTEALRNAIMAPTRVVQNAKRFMGDSSKRWSIGGKSYTPVDVAAAILTKLVRDATRQIGPFDRAVITVPAQFSEAQRLATVEAGRRAGLARVDLINEPVAAALCYVLGTEGLWFSELASEQRILVYDLGGGTFDLSLVSYSKDKVTVIASTGDLNLGGIDWNQCLQNAAADQFTREFGDDPRTDPESLQHLALEVEQCKRSLTVRPRAALIVQHAGKRKTYQIERDQFQILSRHLVKRTEEITSKLIEAHRRGASHLDLTVLSTGGSSRMPMIEEMLGRLKGTKISKVLSPDQSIAHGATYYAGMLLTNSEFVHSITDPQAKDRLSRMRQQSVNARGLGILIRDVKTNRRVPFYLIPPNSPLPASATKTFGTVVPNQKRVNLSIVESGTGPGGDYVVLGTCTIEELPAGLLVESPIDVTISYDASARVTVAGRDATSGKVAKTEIHRGENLVIPEVGDDEEIITLLPVDEASVVRSPPAPVAPAAGPQGTPPVAPVDKPGAPLAPRPAVKPAGGVPPVSQPARVKTVPAKVVPPKPATATQPRAVKPSIKPVPAIKPTPAPRQPTTGEIIELPRKPTSVPPARRPGGIQRPVEHDPGADEFWRFTEQGG